jgi:hypothetical protein
VGKPLTWKPVAEFDDGTGAQLQAAGNGNATRRLMVCVPGDKWHALAFDGDDAHEFLVRLATAWGFWVALQSPGRSTSAGPET